MEVRKISVLLLVSLIELSFGSILRESCSHPIYCYGSLLHTIQNGKIFNDSKTFVDMTMKYSINRTLSNFQVMMSQNQYKPSTEELTKFLYENFQYSGELEEYVPLDFKPEPKILKEIEDPYVREFTKNLHEIWPSLTRRITSDVFDNPQQHSLITVKYGFIIPGGRFREIYYWDSYWIIKGLLLSEMYETARGMVLNLLSLLERFGFIPNGARVYYLNRSQPPLMVMCFYEYVKHTKDYVFLKEHIKTLEIEMKFWLEKRSVEVDKGGQTYLLARYDSESDTPRPESYFEDIETCSIFNTSERQHECYQDIKAGAESGFDFSSRWLVDKNDDISEDLHDIQTRRIIPVDLNAFLYRSFFELYRMYLQLNNMESAEHWLHYAELWKTNLNKVLYHEEDGIWYDYDMKVQQPRRYFAISNFAPLWARALDEQDRPRYGKRAMLYLLGEDCMQYHGTPTTLLETGLQWDFPNAWAPSQSLLIFGLERSFDEDCIELARTLAKKWVRTNIKAYMENEVMFEKYSSLNIGQYGGGGEYQIQSGFGWTNGVMLELINWFFRHRTRKTTIEFEQHEKMFRVVPV